MFSQTSYQTEVWCQQSDQLKMYLFITNIQHQVREKRILNIQQQIIYPTKRRKSSVCNKIIWMTCADGRVPCWAVCSTGGRTRGPHSAETGMPPLPFLWWHCAYTALCVCFTLPCKIKKETYSKHQQRWYSDGNVQYYCIIMCPWGCLQS